MCIHCNKKDFDNVENPKHYQLNGLNIESIEVVKSVVADYKGFSAFCIGNVLKYLIRAKKKNKIEDLEKAKKYLDWLIEKEKLENE